MKNSALFTCLCILLLAACATPKTLTAMGGSKSDGVVHLAYEYGLFEEPVVDYIGGQATAKQRCKAWGYSNAEPFGGEQNDCKAVNGYGNCVHAVVTISYQCTGGKSR